MSNLREAMEKVASLPEASTFNLFRKVAMTLPLGDLRPTRVEDIAEDFYKQASMIGVGLKAIKGLGKSLVGKGKTIGKDMMNAGKSLSPNKIQSAQAIKKGTPGMGSKNALGQAQTTGSRLRAAGGIMGRSIKANPLTYAGGTLGVGSIAGRTTAANNNINQRGRMRKYASEDTIEMDVCNSAHQVAIDMLKIAQIEYTEEKEAIMEKLATVAMLEYQCGSLAHLGFVNDSEMQKVASLRVDNNTMCVNLLRELLA